MKMATLGITSSNRKSFSKNAKLLMFAVAPVAAVLWAHPSLAATLTWDSSGTANSTTPINPVDGSGVWDTLSSLWFDGTTDVIWPNDTTVAVFGSGGTAGTVTLANPITTGGLTFNTSTGDYAIAGSGNLLTLTGAPVVTIAAGQSPTINAQLAGSAGFTMNGPGTLNLSADNSALSGIISINSGTLAIGASSNLGAPANGVILGTAAAPTTGTLTLAPSATTTIGSFAASTNGTTANMLTIGTGAVLNVTSNSTLAGLNSTTNAAFVVGTPNIAGIVTTVLTANGGGTLNVSGGANNSSFLVGVGNTNTSADIATTTVDLTGLTNFSFTTGTGAVPTTGGNEFAVGHGNGATATLSLAVNNTVTAGTITVGDNSVTPGLGNTTNQPNAPGNPSTLNLGSGANVLNANNFVIGSGRAQGVIQWSNTTTTGSLAIAGAAGGPSTANITIGNLLFGTPPSSASNLNLKGHSATVQAGTVIIGELSGSSGGKATTTAGGSVTFDTGTFTAANIKMAVNASGTSIDNLTGTFNQGSSANSTGTLNVTNSFWIADNTNTANASSLASGVFNIKGGTANIGANIIDASTTTASTSSNTTLTLSGGTLNMEGFAIGPIVTNPNNASLSTRHITTVTLPSNTATLANLGGTGINDAGLNMNGTGTLILDGNNTYTGGTTITSGTLQVGAATDTIAPSAPFTAGPGGITDNSILAFGSSQPLTVSGPINGSGGILQNGTGTTTLAVNNGYLGSTTISKGTLQIGNGGSTGTVSSAPVTDNGILAFNRNDPFLTFGNTITGSGAVAQNGPGTVLLTGSNTYSGGTTVSTGTLQVGGATALGFGGLVPHSGGATTVNAASALDLNGQTITQPITLNGGTLTNSNSTAASVTNGILAVGVLAATGPFTGDAVITYSGGGGSGATVNAVLGLSAGSFTVNNGGTGYANGTVAVTITGGGGTGATGTATVVANVVTAINITNPGTGYTTAPSITIAPPTTGTTATALGNANNFVLDGTQELTAGSGYTSAPTATLTATSGTATLATPLISGIILQTLTNSFIGGTGDISVAGPVSGAGSLTKISANTVTFLAPNTYTGDTTVNAGTLLIGSNSAVVSGNITIASNATMSVFAGGSISAAANLTNNGIVNLNSPATAVATLNGATPAAVVNLNTTNLTVSGGGSYAGSINDSGTGGALTVGSALSVGSFQVATVNANANLQIHGTSKTNALNLLGGTGAWTAGLDLSGSKLIIESNAISKPTTIAQLRDQVNTGRTSTNGIFSSTLPSNFGIAVADNALVSNAANPTGFTTFGGLPVDSNSILVAPELLGDANLDGKVTLSDLAVVLNNFGQQPTWLNGGFGSGAVGLSDLADVLNNFGQSNPSPSDGLALSAIAAPEPTSLAVLGVGSAFLTSRRRKGRPVV